MYRFWVNAGFTSDYLMQKVLFVSKYKEKLNLF